MLSLSYSVTACDQKTKDVRGQIQFYINCSSFVISIEVCKAQLVVPKLTVVELSSSQVRVKYFFFFCLILFLL